ncbi:hypothetical protein EYF80_000987 [Liparis tanakae]|uniref:Uncharacterized protein n=1 Tax=Liparis tanakae TaxID=230148 RepID=A0A4Z2JEF9_9TELE|nr:hypothetical protein EYF80_000987 [Liparis tanakae]
MPSVSYSSCSDLRSQRGEQVVVPSLQELVEDVEVPLALVLVHDARLLQQDKVLHPDPVPGRQGTLHHEAHSSFNIHFLQEERKREGGRQMKQILHSPSPRLPSSSSGCPEHHGSRSGDHKLTCELHFQAELQAQALVCSLVAATRHSGHTPTQNLRSYVTENVLRRKCV